MHGAFHTATAAAVILAAILTSILVCCCCFCGSCAAITAERLSFLTRSLLLQLLLLLLLLVRFGSRLEWVERLRMRLSCGCCACLSSFDLVWPRSDDVESGALLAPEVQRTAMALGGLPGTDGCGCSRREACARAEDKAEQRWAEK